MKKTILIIAVTIAVVSLVAVGIFLGTAKESKQLTTENLYEFYDVKVEIKNYIKGQEKAEFLGIFSSYEPSTAKIQITVTPKDDIICDGAQLKYVINENFWKTSDGKENITLDLNTEGTTEFTVDIIADLKLSAAGEPNADDVELTSALGTVTYRKFFNKLK
ncbi:MAG: hypothetical protein IKC01_02325 [Clostridia bacterium]|nr:hypothetical protein [Clostridia bacterium]